MLLAQQYRAIAARALRSNDIETLRVLAHLAPREMSFAVGPFLDLLARLKTEYPEPPGPGAPKRCADLPGADERAAYCPGCQQLVFLEEMDPGHPHTTTRKTEETVYQNYAVCAACANLIRTEPAHPISLRVQRLRSLTKRKQ